MLAVRAELKKYNCHYLFLLGTQWCGIGEREEASHSAKNISRTDECCKEHDSCPHYIPRWNKRYNLFNWRLFTISSCACDDKFRDCLHKDNSLSSKDIKSIYFDMLKIPCFEIELKETKTCVAWHWYLQCKQYKDSMVPYAKIRS